MIDELVLDIVPVLLGAGEPIFDGIADPGLTPVEVIHSELATHVRYRAYRQETTRPGSPIHNAP